MLGVKFGAGNPDIPNVRAACRSAAVLVAVSIAMVVPNTSAAAEQSAVSMLISPGDCLTWMGRATAYEVRVVDCSKPHVMEMTGTSVRVPGRTYPSKTQWHELIARLCAPAVERYIGRRLDPDGRYEPVALRPDRSRWQHSDHDLRCGIRDKVGMPGDHDRFTGPVIPTDQSYVYPVGTCMVDSTQEEGRWTSGDCEGVHHAEVAGIVDLDGRFDHLPSDDEVDLSVADECIAATGTYLGRPVDFLHDDLFPSLTPSADSWDLGSRTINCLVGRVENGQPVDLSGPLR